MRSAVFTIIAKNYLPFARVLMSSLRAWAPELKRFVILADKPDGYFDPAAEDFEVILSEELGIPESQWFHFKYTILELSTAIKPYAASFILERCGCDCLLYFDPDIHVYHDLNPVMESLRDHNIVLTPHLTAPLEDQRRPSELDILRSGSYNLGFIAIRRSDETGRFLQWWQKRLYEHCVVDLEKGLFVDQRWVDLVPGMFERVDILRDPGLNVAYWNVGHRPVTGKANELQVNGSPLRFFHFSGFDPDNPHTFSRHQNRFTLDNFEELRGLMLDYRAKLFENGYSSCKSWPYAYGSFANGFPIPDIGRPVHHEAPETFATVSDPFSAEGHRAFIDIWNQRLAGPDGETTSVTRLAYRIYRSRSDVQEAMPDIFRGDLLRFLNWIIKSGTREHNLSEVFVAPIREGILNHERTSKRNTEPKSDGREPLVNEKIIGALRDRGLWIENGAPVQVETLNKLVSNGASGVRLSQLAKAIYESRPDLQGFFPDPCGQDGIRFLAWFLTYGATEYRLSHIFTSPLRTEWDTALRGLESPLEKAWHRLVLLAMGGSVALRDNAGSFVSRARLARAIPRNGSNGIALPGNGVVVHRKTPIENSGSAVRGVNLIGYSASEMGVGESVRCAFKAARAIGLEVAVRSIDEPGPYRRQDLSISGHEGVSPHAINVFHVNADESARVFAKMGESFSRDRHNVGFWAWELEEFPAKWASAFRLFDEIWTPSSFCQSSIARKSPVPVLRMPHAVTLETCKAAGRFEFGIPEDAFLFIAVFDLLSVFERKNPLAVIAAFRAAFSGSPGYHLLLKVNHADQKPVEMARIRAEAMGLPVTIVDRTIDRKDLTALMQMADCLVSLHRSEGFGLTMAEAMYLSKPVIATAYSGNLDFTTPDNAFLVDYDLVPVPVGCEPYEEGALWADPRVEVAVEQMQLVAGNPTLRERRARRGRDRIHEHFSPQAVGKLMLERLNIAAPGSKFQNPRENATAAAD